MAGRSREYDIAFRLNGLMDPSFRQSMGNAERHIEELERALREMSRRGDLDDLRDDADRVDDSLRNLNESAGGFGDTLKKVAEYTGAFALIEAAGVSMQNIVGVIGDQSDAMAQFQASTGMTADQMVEINAISEDLYKQNYGEGFEDLTDVMATVKQFTNQTGDALENTTKTAMAFRDVFKEDVPESLKAADTMMKKFGTTSGQSYNLMAQGAQKGLNKSGDLIDTVNEYSVYFDKMGYSADGMFDVFSAGMENGAFSLDKVADVVKEFGIRIKDGSVATNDAIYALFAPDDIDAWANAFAKGGKKSAQYMELLKKEGQETADILLGDFKKGGKTAEKAMKELQMYLGGGNRIFDGLADGSMTGKQAMEDVITKLKEIEDPVYQGQIAVSLFGTQFEDMEADAVLALGNTRKQFDMTKQTMEEVAAVKYDTLTQQFQTIGRELMVEVVLPIGEDLMPVLEGLADWMGDNKELLMVIALGTPAVMLGKSTVKIVKNLLTIQGAAGGAGGAAGGFTKALALLTNPVGLAVTGVAALTLGVIAYKKHQEKARQELLNMGEALEDAYSNYSEVDAANKKTKDLIAEYDRLTTKIKNAQTPADELTEARRKLKLVEEDLINMNPDILSAEDAKTDRFREQLGFVEGIQEAREEMSRRELEHSALEAKAKLPDLESQYIDLTKDLSKQSSAYEDAKESYASYVEFMNQYQEIDMNVADGDEKIRKFGELVERIKEVTGVSYEGPGGLMIFGDDYRELEASFDKYNKKIETNQKEMAEAEESFQNYYNLQVQMIENELGGSIDEMAKKYKTASEIEKKRFEEAARLIAQLNDEVNLLPSEKKIDLQVAWQQTGRAPDLNTSEGRKIQYLSLRDPGFEGYADGGIATKASIFGESGPEIAIPLNNKPRSRSLLDMANDMMGYTKNENREGDIIIHNAPVITLPGADPSVMKLVKEALKQSEDNLERKIKAIIEQQRRVSFS